MRELLTILGETWETQGSKQLPLTQAKCQGHAKWEFRGTSGENLVGQVSFSVPGDELLKLFLLLSVFTVKQAVRARNASSGSHQLN